MTNTAPHRSLQEVYRNRRRTTELLTEGLSAEDMVVQSMADASPAKWHLAHTTWFFEEFVLCQYQDDYRVVDPNYGFLFNSYYESVGERHARPLRGLLTRPGIDAVLAYRHTVDNAIVALLERQHPRAQSIANTVTVGLHHEMQHEELLLTDILHALSINPMFPAVRNPSATASGDATIGKVAPSTADAKAAELEFFNFDEGLYKIGATGGGFSFDCEHPLHQTYVQSFALANRPVSNREWQEFMHDGGYGNPTLWLADGWARCQTENWRAPLYWIERGDQWLQFGLDGLQPLEADAPVCHISYFEAHAFAQWAGYRLPTEQEWELAAKEQPVGGNLLESGNWRPLASRAEGIRQLYGDIWEWTRSPYTPYPGFKVAPGAIGEYNGKFMCGQFVLRGGSCVTPQQQLRPSYRNFFYPHQRWQFSGLRLAKDI